MKNIILANIGNRNLTYQGQLVVPDGQATKPEESFREKTKTLLDQYDDIENELDEQILSRLLAQIKPDQIEKVVLFASDQLEKHKQDTIFEARILQKLLKKKFGVEVEVVEYKQNVTDNDALLTYYRGIFSSWRVQHPDALFIVCDAGGTPQQKAALKIAAEFLFKPSQYNVKYITQPYGGKPAQVVDVEQVEYRRIIDEEQVVALVEHGQYAGALYIYEHSTRPNNDALALLRILANRAELFYRDAQQLVNTSLKGQSPFLSNFMGGKPSGIVTPFKNVLSDKAFFALCERLEIAHFRYSLGDWSRTVLGLSIFIESFVNEAIQQQGHFKLVGEYDKAARSLLSQVIENPDYTYILAYFGGANAIRLGLPVHLKYAEQTGSEAVRDVVHQFLPMNSRTNQSDGKLGLDCLRNRLAHKGENVKETDLRKHTPTLDATLQNLRKLIGLPEENSYITLNRLLVSLLRS